MNRRVNKIVLDILHKDSISILEYTNVFKVSERTILNDISSLNRYFNDKVIFINNSGYPENNPKFNLVEVFNHYLSFQNYILSPEERQTVLALLLILKKEYITTYFLSDYVKVSRNTLLSDIDELKKWFDKHSIRLESYTGKGYLIKGDEIAIRKHALDLVIHNGLFEQENEYAFYKGYENHIFQNLLFDIINGDMIYEKLRKIVIKSEVEQNIQLSDYSLKEVLYYLLIMVKRIENGKIISDIINQSTYMLHNSSKYSLSNNICQLLQEEFNIDISMNETLYLTSILRTKSYIKNNSRKLDSIEIQILVNEFMYLISKEFDIKYYLNSDLFDLFANHLKSMIYRIKQNNTIQNVLYEEIKEEHRSIFPKVKKYIKGIEHYLGQEVNETEVSFIVMYIVSIIDNNKIIKPKVRIKLVCTSGQGTAQLIKQNISSLFRQTEVVGVESTHSIDYFNDYNEDLIVSTVPIPPSNVPTIVVNAILNEIDIVRLQKKISEIQDLKFITEDPNSSFYSKIEIFKRKVGLIGEKYIENKKDLNLFIEEVDSINNKYLKTMENRLEENVENLSDLLTINRIEIDVEVNDWKEAIRYAGTLLYKDAFISLNYIDSMIDIVEKNNPYIVIAPGIAIPHAESSDGGFKTGASFIKLKKSVPFYHENNDPVQYVIAFSISDTTNIGTCLYNFTEIVSRYHFLEEMDNCTNSKAIFNKLKELENRIKGEF